jgi:putative hemolysin
MQTAATPYEVRFATDPDDLRAAARLRYAVFVEELGGDGPDVDHDARLERDGFDAHCAHLVLIDPARDRAALDHVVGVYRLMGAEGAAAAGRFYTEGEFDLTPLKASGRKLMELGRSCLHPAYRGGSAMLTLWQALSAHVEEEGVEILFGTASFHGTDIAALAEPLSALHWRHLAPPELRVRAHPFQRIDLMPEEAIDRLAAARATPPLIKAYLRLGGVIGEGAFIDHAFNTTDVCLVLDVARSNAAQRALYARAGA